LQYSEFDRDDLEDGSSSNINDRATFSKITPSMRRKSTEKGKDGFLSPKNLDQPQELDITKKMSSTHNNEFDLA
jgi:hypothetical protein